MSRFRVIPGRAAQRAVAGAAARNVALSITVRHHNRWVTYSTWIIAHHGDVLWFDMPVVDGALVDHAFETGERISVSYRMAQRRYIGTVEVLGIEPYEVADTVRSLAVRITAPPELRLVERRLAPRVSLPSALIARATIWLGAAEMQTQAGDLDCPSWSGKIVNLSAAGVYMRTNREAPNYMEIGDIVGVRLNLGVEHGEVILEAQLRHYEPDGEMALLGFQFLEARPNEDEVRQALDAVEATVDLYRDDESSDELPGGQAV